MITREQINDLAKQYRVSETVVFREYLQIAFLRKFYQKTPSQNVYFKGGTAIHLLYQSPRFSEDLDFTVGLPMSAFMAYVGSVLKRLEIEEGMSWKEKKSVAGKQFLLTSPPGILPYNAFVSLDFSFREKIVFPDRSIIQSAYPALFTSYVHHPSREEILAEKIRAVMTREKGRDLYDLWYLLSKGTPIKSDLVGKKLAYYKLSGIANEDILARVASFSKKNFTLDLRPYVPMDERGRLPEFYEFLQEQIKLSLK